VKLVQMPTALLHLDEAELDGAGIDPGLLAAFRAYLPCVSSELPPALNEPRGVLILASASAGGHHLLMVLARRIGAALRDANIHLRDRGGDMKAARQKLCYLPGPVLVTALGRPDLRLTLIAEAACFAQDLEAIWRPGSAGAASPGLDALRSLLDERLAAGRPTFLQAHPGALSQDVEAMLRARLPALESAGGRA
jgi:hypothetical protein